MEITSNIYLSLYKDILLDYGIIVEKNNPQNLSRAINYALKLYENPEKRLLEFYKENGYKHIKENFSIENIVKEFLSLY